MIFQEICGTKNEDLPHNCGDLRLFINDMTTQALTAHSRVCNNFWQLKAI